MNVTDPTVTRNADGSLTVEWPDPPRDSYLVSHEALAEMITHADKLSRIAAIIAEAAA